MRRRVATPDELERAIRHCGLDGARAALRRYGLIPPVAGMSSLAIDTSTPAALVTNGTAASLTTGSFTPPLGSLLAVIFGTGYSATSIGTPSNSGGTVSWNASAAASEAASVCAAAIWLGTVTSSAAMTVTCTPTSLIGQWGFGCAVITGQAATQNGATNVGTSSSNALPTCTISSLVGTDSLVIGAVGNESNGTTGTPGAGQSVTFNGNAFTYSGGGGSGWGQYLTGMNLPAGSSATINDTAPSIHYSIVVVEILAATGGAAAAPNPQIVNWPQAMWRSAYR